MIVFGRKLKQHWTALGHPGKDYRPLQRNQQPIEPWREDWREQDIVNDTVSNLPSGQPNPPMFYEEARNEIIAKQTMRYKELSKR